MSQLQFLENAFCKCWTIAAEDAVGHVIHVRGGGRTAF